MRAEVHVFSVLTVFKPNKSAMFIQAIELRFCKSMVNGHLYEFHAVGTIDASKLQKFHFLAICFDLLGRRK